MKCDSVTFQSVFTQDDGDDISEMDKPDYLQINNLTINVKGVEKLLKKLTENQQSLRPRWSVSLHP